MTSVNKQYPDTFEGASNRVSDAWQEFVAAIGRAFTLEDDARKLARELDQRKSEEIVRAKVRRHRKRQAWKAIKTVGYYALWAIGLVATFVAGWVFLIVVGTPAGACEPGTRCGPPEISDAPAIDPDLFGLTIEQIVLGDAYGIDDLEQLTAAVKADILILSPRLDPTWAGELAGLILEHGNEYSLNLKLVVALCMTESSFQPGATNPDTYCAGLMQLHPMHGIPDVYDPVINMHWGCLKLRKYIDDKGSVRGGLRRYGTKVDGQHSVGEHLKKLGAYEVLLE